MFVAHSSCVKLTQNLTVWVKYVTFNTNFPTMHRHTGLERQYIAT